MQASIRLSGEIEQLTALFDNRTEAVQGAVDAYVNIRKYTLRELKGIFVREELIGLIDNLNGSMLQADYQANKSMYIAHLEDGEHFENMSERFNFDFQTLINKVNSLTSAQIFFLQAEIERYWRQDSSKDDSLNKFIEQFL
jgi:hypothetical protein